MRAHSREVSTSSAAITQRGGFFAERRTREDHELGAAGAEELARLGLTQADLAEQAGEYGHVDPVGVRGHVVERHPRVARRSRLSVQVLPLADAQEVQELLARQLGTGCR